MWLFRRWQDCTGVLTVRHNISVCLLNFELYSVSTSLCDALSATVNTMSKERFSLIYNTTINRQCGLGRQTVGERSRVHEGAEFTRGLWRHLYQTFSLKIMTSCFSWFVMCRSECALSFTIFQQLPLVIYAAARQTSAQRLTLDSYAND